MCNHCYNILCAETADYNYYIFEGGPDKFQYTVGRPAQPIFFGLSMGVGAGGAKRLLFNDGDKRYEVGKEGRKKEGREEEGRKGGTHARSRLS